MNNLEWKELCLGRETLKKIREEIKIILESDVYKENTRIGHDFVEQRIVYLETIVDKYYWRIAENET